MTPELSKVCEDASALLGHPWLITDCTGAVNQNSASYPTLSGIFRIVLHRIEVAKTAKEIAEWFAANPTATGSPTMPYKWVITPAGDIQQAMQFDRVTPHAAGYNTRTLSIGIVGDFRSLDDLGDEEVHQGITGVLPTPQQVAATIACCVRIRDALRRDIPIVGHTDIAADKLKRCPGTLFPVDFVQMAADAYGRITWNNPKKC